MRLLGLDPGLQETGWGVIEAEGNRLRHVANGTVSTTAQRPLAERLNAIYEGLVAVIERHKPDAAAVEEAFLNKNPATTLRLYQARGVVLLAPARCGVPVSEYAARYVKKAVVGTGSAEKAQVRAMVARLLPGAEIVRDDAADALAVAICHGHFATTDGRWREGDRTGIGVRP
ncbi:MAG: crossover junction endodeoxyribonuclease RuvC [Alphaproteobacteria bacterium]|nr:crossover junction endodeoxyribonuclease RuvC [Alphaproteobacteria bacterium]